MENGIFFKFEILAANIDLSQILKNICQQLLSLNNVLKKPFYSNNFIGRDLIIISKIQSSS